MASDRFRLLLLSPLPPPTGGISNWTLAVLRSRLAERFEIRVVNTSPSEKTAVHGRSRLRIDRVGDALRALVRLVVELICFRPQLLHVNTPYYWAFLRDGLAVWIARAFGVPTVLHFRGGDFPAFAETGPRTRRRAVRATLRRANRLVALERHTQTYLESLTGHDRVCRVPNFVRLEDVGSLPDRAARSGPIEVLFVGWILEAKGVRELLQVARALPNLRFTLVGPEQADFVASVRADLDALADRVRLLKSRPRECVFELYRQADVFVLPTWREGFPNVVLEAMAAGLPVVATPVGAIPDMIRDGEEGLLVPARDAAALTHALGRLANDPGLRARLGARARARVEALYSCESVLGDLEALWLELIR